MDALSTVSVFVMPLHSTLHWLLGHELRPGSQAAEDEDRCGYVSMWHFEDKPYSDSVKAAYFPCQPYGLPESVSFGGVRDSDLSTAEAIFDLVFSSTVKIKRCMKYQLGILCLILVPPIPLSLWDAEPLAN